MTTPDQIAAMAAAGLHGAGNLRLGEPGPDLGGDEDSHGDAGLGYRGRHRLGQAGEAANLPGDGGWTAA